MYQVQTLNKIIGTHCWKDAPPKYNYLANEHRHTFHIRCWFNVTKEDREIEFIDMQEIIKKRIKERFATLPNGKGVAFGGMSCESIARFCIDEFGCQSCEVLEDGEGGAYVRE